MKVLIQIVTWNSLRWLHDCLDSIFAQTYRDFSVLLIDNASHDQTIEYLQQQWPEIGIFHNYKNIGFSAGHNLGIKLTKQFDYLLVMNPDVILQPDCLAKLVQAIESDQSLSSVGPKLFKFRLDKDNPNYKIKTDILDSTGLKILTSRRVINRGESEKDIGQYNQIEKVFGFSGSLVLYRYQALKDIKINDEYFDEDFFAYQEDIDLSWRLLHRGWNALYLPEACAYHFRHLAGKEKFNLWQKIKQQYHRPSLLSFYSYRNHLLVLLKNDHFTNLFKQIIRIKFYEMGKFLVLLLLKPAVLAKSLCSFFRLMPRMLKKRRQIMRRSKLTSEQARSWFK
ncbi:MAG: glycosyltransferase family 2 protein [Candidatus Aenigmarchaeota archaeon]|nr:glycosyltransferase family 2 protein [Candidatus Aenigmarchaeota archaeon]